MEIPQNYIAIAIAEIFDHNVDSRRNAILADFMTQYNTTIGDRVIMK